MITEITLSADGLEPLTLLDHPDIDVEEFDVGEAEVREVANVRAGMDGEDDETQYHGGRVVSVSATVWDVSLVDRLRAFTRPSLRPVLTYRPEGASRRRLRLRASSSSAPLSADLPTGVAVQVQWRAPDGVAESVDEQVQLVNPAGDEDGRSYDLSFDRSWPESQGPGRVEIVNEGSATAYPVFRIYGPLTDPLIENETSGRQLSFDIEVSQGDYLEVDTAARTIRLNGLEANNRYDTLDFPTSQWFGLRPGVNLIRFAPESSSAPAVCEVRWRGAWL